MKKKTGKTRTLYNSEFKEMAIKLAKELGSTREAAEAYINRGIAKTELHIAHIHLWIVSLLIVF